MPGRPGRTPPGLSERARLALRDAGDRALELDSFAAAAYWYAAALELWPTDDAERPRLLLQLGKARVHAEQAGGELLEAAREELLAAGDREAAAEAEQLLGVLLTHKGQGERAIGHGRRAVELLEDAGPSRVKAAALISLASSLIDQGPPEEAVRVGRQALAMAEALGLDQEQAVALDCIGYARVLGGDRGGINDLEQAVTIAVQANSPHSAGAYGNLASVLIALGDLARGFQLQAKGRQAAERFGFASFLRHFRAEQAQQDYWLGRWDAALAGADQFVAEAEAGSPHYVEHVCLQVRGLLANRRIQDAGARASEVLAILAERGALVTTPDWSGHLAVVLHVLGRGSELLALAASVADPTAWLRAATAIAAGDCQQAADRYVQIGSLPDEAFARLRAAEQLLSAGRRADAKVQLQRALAFYRQVGAVGYLREVDALFAASA